MAKKQISRSKKAALSFTLTTPQHRSQALTSVMELWEIYFDGNQSQRQDESPITASWEETQYESQMDVTVMTKMRRKACAAKSREGREGKVGW